MDNLVSNSDSKKIIDDLKSFLIRVIRHIGTYHEDIKSLEKDISNMTDLIKSAQSVDDLNNVRTSYREFIIKMEEAPSTSTKSEEKKGNLLSSIFGKSKGEKLKSSGVALINEEEEFNSSIRSLVSAFAKGALMMTDKQHPLNELLTKLKEKEFKALDIEEIDSTQKNIVNYFFSKSNEVDLIEKEREELKELIFSLTEQIGKLSSGNESFNKKLIEYSLNINQSLELDDIRKIKKKLIEETELIQAENSRVKESLNDSQNKLKSASKKIEELETELKKVRIDMMIDALTEIYNRGAFDERISEQILRYKRYKEPFSLLMFDVDHFKKFNDKYGHQAGDIVLKTISRLAKEPIRETDFLARYGGEEFVIIIDKSKPENAAEIAEKVRSVINSHEFVYRKHTIKVSVSIGAAQYIDGDSVTSIIQKADKALYEAKKSGRNRVATFE